MTTPPFSHDSVHYIRVIASTSKSKIWLSELSHDQLVVVKEIPLSYLAASPHRVDHAWEERAILRHLERSKFSKSPKLIATSKTDESLLFIMELILGAPLHLHLPISFERAQKFFSQILDIVEFLHNQSIVHKDIKLSNFILSENSGEIYICDFGLSVRIQKTADQPASHAPPIECTCGTEHTMAPESTVSFAQDFYSLGILLYELLTPSPMKDQNWRLDLSSIDHLPDAVDLISQLIDPDLSSRLSKFSEIRNHSFLKNRSLTLLREPRDSSIGFKYIFGRDKSVLDDF